MRAVWAEIDGLGSVTPLAYAVGDITGWPTVDDAELDLTGWGVQPSDVGQVVALEIITDAGGPYHAGGWLVQRRRAYIETATLGKWLGPAQEWVATPETSAEELVSARLWIERKTRFCLAQGVPDWAPADGSWIDGGLHTVEGQVAQTVPDLGGVASSPSLVIRFAYDGFSPIERVARLARYQYDLERAEGSQRAIKAGYPLLYRGLSDDDSVRQIEGYHMIEGEACHGWTSQGFHLLRAVLDTDHSNAVEASVVRSGPGLRSARVRIYESGEAAKSLADARLLFAGYVSDYSLSDDGASLDAYATGALSASAFRAAWLSVDSSEPQSDGTIRARRRARRPEYQWGVWDAFAVELTAETSEDGWHDTYSPSEAVPEAGIALVGPFSDFDEASLTTWRWEATSLDRRGRRSEAERQAREHREAAGYLAPGWAEGEFSPVRYWLDPTDHNIAATRLDIARLVGGGVFCHLYRASAFFSAVILDLDAGRDELGYARRGRQWLDTSRRYRPTVHAADAILQVLTSTGTGTNTVAGQDYGWLSVGATADFTARSFDLAPRAFGLGIPADLIDVAAFVEWAKANPSALIRDLIAFEDDAATVAEFLESKILEPFGLVLCTNSRGLVTLKEAAVFSRTPSAAYSAPAILRAEGSAPPRVQWSIRDTPPTISAVVRWANPYYVTGSARHRQQVLALSDSELSVGGDLYFSRLEARRLTIDIEGGVYQPDAIGAPLKARLRRDAVPLPVLTFPVDASAWQSEPGDIVEVQDFPIVPDPNGERGATVLLEILSVTRPVVDSVMASVTARVIDVSQLIGGARWAPGWQVVFANGSTATVGMNAYSPAGSPAVSDPNWAAVGLKVAVYDEFFTRKAASGLFTVTAVNGDVLTLDRIMFADDILGGDILLPAPWAEQSPEFRARWAYVEYESYAVEWL